MEIALMAYARVFQSGNSQAVRLPKDFRIQSDRVEIFRQGNDIVLREHAPSAAAIFDVLTELPAELFSEPRVDAPPQEREGL
jgi:antitoxin VapB